MKLHSLTARNFMPYKGDMELTFPQDEHRNVMIVFGDNMRGKTSILNAVRWAFYGEALGRHSRPIPLQKIVNTEATLADDWRVEVHVKFNANGYSYDLRRVAERRGLVATPQKPEDFTQSIHLTRNGVPVSGDQVEAEIGLGPVDICLDRWLQWGDDPYPNQQQQTEVDICRDAFSVTRNGSA